VAIAPIDDSMKFVEGGTGWAVAMAQANNKEINVFNLKDNSWYKWNGNTFVKSSVPTLSKNFAGIGSRQDKGKMTPESIQAIRDVYENTFNATTQPSTNVEPKGEKFKDGVYINQEGLSPAEELELFELIRPVLEQQAVKSNTGTNAPKMAGLGLNWDYLNGVTKRRDNGFEKVNIPDPLRKNSTYGWFTSSSTGQKLGSISKRMVELMTKATGIDVSDYDGSIINIYNSDSFIGNHPDIDESKTAEKYPVVVVNIGGPGNIILGTNRITDNKNLKSGAGYVFGVGGKNRTIPHSTYASPIKGTLPSITTQMDGETLKAGSYRISVTMRRVMPLEQGMPEAPKIISEKPKILVPQRTIIRKAKAKEIKDPKFVATGVFIKDDKIYTDLNRLNNIYVSLEDNIDTTKNIGGVSIKYPPKKAFRSFTEFVNYSLEKENLRYVLGKQEAKEIAIRMAASVGNRKRKFDDKKFTLKREYNASDEKVISQLLQTGGIEVTNEYGLLDLVDNTTGEVVLSNYKRGPRNYIKEYEVEPFNIISDAVETYLMDTALKNINNVYSYTQHSGLDYPTQLLDIINQYPELTTNYLLPSLFSPRKIKNSRNIQLVINQNDLDPRMISLLHEQYKELADETKVKVADKEANKYISKLFQQLSTYSLLTEGFSKQKTSNLSEIIGQEDLLEIGSFNNINRYVSDKLSKKLDFNGKSRSTNFLNDFSKKFFRNRLGLTLDNNGDWKYSKSGISNTKEYLIEDYVAKPTVPENIDNVKYLKKFSDNYYIINVNGIAADSSSSPDKSFKSKTLIDYANMFSDVTFIFDKATMKTLGLTNLKADNIKVVNSPEALESLDIQGPIALPSNGLDKTFNTVITEKFGIFNLQKGIMDNASLGDIINSDSLLVTTDIVNLIRAKAQRVLDELNNSC
jgi:hypothetical protein